jgi:hypothetical protein
MKLPAALILSTLALSGCGLMDRMRGDGGADPVALEPPAATLAPEDRFVQAVEAQGCLLNADNLSAVLLAANLTQAELGPIVSALNAEGRAEAAGEGAIRVLSANCI